MWSVVEEREGVGVLLTVLRWFFCFKSSLFFASVVSCVEFVLSLFVAHFSFF